MPTTVTGAPEDDDDVDSRNGERLRRIVESGEISAFREAGKGRSRDGVVGMFRMRDGRVAAFVVVRCETDFVAQHERFHAFADDLAMHVALAHPLAASVDALTAQPYAPDSARGTVGDVLRHASSKDGFGETIEISRFERWTVGS